MEAFLKKFENAHLLVAGEVGIDEYIFGDTRRISPEGPVPVVEVHSQAVRLGMAANVAQNITSLKGKVTLVSVRGDDADGERLEKMVSEAGVPEAHWITDTSRPTLRKVRVMAQKQHVVRVDYERSHILDAKLAKEFNDRICDQLSQVDGVIVEDYGKGVWNPDTLSFIQKAKAKKIPVFVDPNRHTPLKYYRQATLITPNREEAETLVGWAHERKKMGADDKAYLLRMAKKLMEEAELEHSIITCGAEGMVSLSRGIESLNHIPTYAREVFDVTGAGDTVIAVLSLMQVCGASLEDSMRVANAAAGIVVSRIGTSTVGPEELAKEMLRLRSTGILI